MRLTTPEISWHRKDPIFSFDFSLKIKAARLATSGANSNIRIWAVHNNGDNGSRVEFIANLSRHNKAVNVVRFSPQGSLCSCYIHLIIWGNAVLTFCNLLHMLLLYLSSRRQTSERVAKLLYKILPNATSLCIGFNLFVCLFCDAFLVTSVKGVILGALVTGFIYNSKTSDGVDQFRNSVDDIQNDINHASTMGKGMRVTLRNTQGMIETLYERSGTHAAEEAYNLSFKMIGSLDAVNGLLPQNVVNESSDVGDKVHRYDNYRWLATIILLSWCILLCIFLFWTSCQVNACILVMATIFSLLTVLFTWTFVGADFAIATGIGDFCVHPKKAIETIKKGNATSIVISYYMDCSGAEYNPFSENLAELQRTINQVINLIEQVPDFEDLKTLIIKGLYSVNRRLPIYEESFTCHSIHEEYMEAMDGLCEKTLNSLAVVMLAVLIIAFFSGLLTCLICPLWNYRRARPTIYNDIRNSPDDIGNAVLWWPHDVDANSERSFYQRHGEPTERSPLIANTENQPNPNYERGYQPNLNFIHVNYHHNAGSDRHAENRHSF